MASMFISNPIQMSSQWELIMTIVVPSITVIRIIINKALHDELEAVYRPYMDFAALTDFTEAEIARIFA